MASTGGQANTLRAGHALAPHHGAIVRAIAEALREGNEEDVAAGREMLRALLLSFDADVAPQQVGVAMELYGRSAGRDAAVTFSKAREALPSDHPLWPRRKAIIRQMSARIREGRGEGVAADADELRALLLECAGGELGSWDADLAVEYVGHGKGQEDAEAAAKYHDALPTGHVLRPRRAVVTRAMSKRLRAGRGVSVAVGSDSLRAFLLSFSRRMRWTRHRCSRPWATGGTASARAAPRSSTGSACQRTPSRMSRPTRSPAAMTNRRRQRRTAATTTPRDDEDYSAADDDDAACGDDDD
jgi:hypothetical protein